MAALVAAVGVLAMAMAVAGAAAAAADSGGQPGECPAEALAAVWIRRRQGSKVGALTVASVAAVAADSARQTGGCPAASGVAVWDRPGGWGGFSCACWPPMCWVLLVTEPLTER